MQNFRQLKLWEKSHQLTLKIYHLSQSFPKNELYGLTSQMRRACSSIPTNLAEGCGQNSDAQLARFSQIAMGSASEVEYHLLLCRDLSYSQEKEFKELDNEITETKKMLASFLKKLRADS